MKPYDPHYNILPPAPDQCSRRSYLTSFSTDMESSDLARMPCKSRKPFTSATGTKASGEAAVSTKTPDSKPPPLINPNRIRNRGVALSISEVRKAAESLRESNRDKPGGETKSARKQILSWESPVKKQKPKGSEKLPEK